MKRQTKQGGLKDNPFILDTYKVKEFEKTEKLGTETNNSWITRHEFKSYITRDVEDFVKLYNIKKLNDILNSLPPICDKMFRFILTLVRTDSDTIYIDQTALADLNLSKTAFYDSIKAFQTVGLIAKAAYCQYYINLNYFFKGNRIKFILDNYGEDHFNVI